MIKKDERMKGNFITTYVQYHKGAKIHSWMVSMYKNILSCQISPKLVGKKVVKNPLLAGWHPPWDLEDYGLPDMEFDAKNHSWIVSLDINILSC